MRGFEMLGALDGMDGKRVLPNMPVFDILGVTEEKPKDAIVPAKRTDEWIAVAATLAGGAIGTYLGYKFPVAGRRHEVLGLLNGLALAGNAARVATGEITPRRAAENVGSHLIATVGSLSLPNYPVIGYLAGAASANLFLRRDDTYLERLEETALGGPEVFEGTVEESRPSPSRAPEIVDAELVGFDWTPAPTLAAVRAGLAAVKRNHRGDSVTYVQGVAGAVADSEFGESTERAVKAFQSTHGLTVTGVVDRETIAAMDALAGGSGSATRVDFTEPQAQARASPKQSTAIVKNLDSDLPTNGRAAPAGESGGLLLFGRPIGQVILAIVGILLAGGGVVYALGSGDR